MQRKGPPQFAILALALVLCAPAPVPSAPRPGDGPPDEASPPADGGLAPEGTPTDSYRVFPLPFESPQDPGAAHVLVDDPADLSASPFAWHDVDGVAGADFTDTRGNNVFAQEDVDGNNTDGARPDGDAGGGRLIFDYPFDPALPPDGGTNQEAGIVNLFYWMNLVHDIAHRRGFDEAGGNFQQNNYGNGGAEGDPVFADTQDGGCVNCSFFGTPPDGFSPRIETAIWLPPPEVEVISPPAIVGVYPAGRANFGPPIDEVGVSGELELVNDGTAAGSEGCNPLVGFTPGRIAVIDRGNCEFGTKVLNAQLASAIGAIVVNDQGDGLLDMGPGSDGPLVVIPSVFLGQSDGQAIKDELPALVEVILRAVGQPRDGALDSSLNVHQHGHGISIRLTGGPGNVSCLQHAEQPGEGWSDFWSLVLTAKATDTPSQPRGLGTYALFQPPDATGWRDFPYTTDLTINPLTFGDVATVSAPHGVGTVWASLLWEVYWRLVGSHGFDPDFYTGNGGNNQALQLVTDGMKLQPCTPSFVDARDAILTADVAAFGGANQCLIWQGFARRGLGASASSGSPLVVGDEVEAFDLPAACQTVFADDFESGDTSAWSGTVP